MSFLDLSLACLPPRKSCSARTSVKLGSTKALSVAGLAYGSFARHKPLAVPLYGLPSIRRHATLRLPSEGAALRVRRRASYLRVPAPTPTRSSPAPRNDLVSRGYFRKGTIQ